MFDENPHLNDANPSIDNQLPCPTNCGGILQQLEFESTMTEKKYLCSNPKCPRKTFVVKTGLGQAAQAAPVVLAFGVILGIFEQFFKEGD